MTRQSKVTNDIVRIMPLFSGHFLQQHKALEQHKQVLQNYIKFENFRTEKFRKNNFGQKTFGPFSSSSDEKLLDKNDIKKQA